MNLEAVQFTARSSESESEPDPDPETVPESDPVSDSDSVTLTDTDTVTELAREQLAAEQIEHLIERSACRLARFIDQRVG
jgi:hypothetical protein